MPRLVQANTTQRVESFQVDLTADELPPKPWWVEQQLRVMFAGQAELIQWAIVRVEKDRKRLHIEGCRRVFSGGTNRLDQVE